MYEVWTVHEDGQLGVLLCISTKAGCNRYIRQAVKKGANPDTLVIRKA